MNIDFTQYPDGDLKGQTLVNPMIQNYNGPPATLRNGTLINAQILNSANITLDGVKIVGDNGKTPVAQIKAKGLFVRRSSRISILNCDVGRSFVGVTFLDSPDCRIDASDFHDSRDHFHGTAADGLIISRTAFHDNHNAPGDHPDAIQCFDGGAGRPIKNITIQDNIYYRGAGNTSQGIFMQQAYDNLIIMGNVVIGGMGNGIRADGARSGKIVSNVVYSYIGGKSGLFASKAIALNGNQAFKFNVGGAFLKTAPAGNVFNKEIAPLEEAALVAAWRKRVFG